MDKDEITTKVYELGVQIVPDIGEEKVAEVWADLKSIVSKAKGTELSEGSPELVDLAYTMVKHVAGKNKRYDTAYFAWVKFEVNPEAIANMNELSEANQYVLRSMIIKTVRENTLFGHKYSEDGTRKEVLIAAPEAGKAPDVDKPAPELVV